MNIKKVYTDNPFMDALVYCVQTLVYSSIVKIPDMANNAETVSSLSNSDLYMSTIEGNVIFDIFTYTKEILEQSSVPKTKIFDYVKDKYLIPEQYRDELVSIAAAKCISSYKEENEYYRMICGMPPLGDYGIPIKAYEYLVPEGNNINVTYVHQLGADGCRMLDSYGILDIIKADYPDAKYLNYIMAGISIYKARKAIDFQLLYSPTTSNLDIDDKFASKYEINRIYILRTTYSAAFKISSDYYDNFIAILIILMTMIDMLTEVQEHIVKKDILDSRCIEYIFSIYGIPYYHTIPLKYQASMCRNINTLVKYKSSETGMLNLISLFGMNDIEMFKYFILKDRKVDRWGNFLYTAKIDITSSENDIVKHTTDQKLISDNVIPYPFDYFLQKGNEMFVWLDGYRLKRDIDYEIYNYNLIRFKNGIDTGKTTIRYDFYYDINTVSSEVSPDVENAITMVTDVFTNTSIGNTFNFTPPTSTYFSDGNHMIVMVGGVCVDPNAYILDLNSNTITINAGYNTIGRQVTFIYLYGKKLTTKFKINNIVAEYDNQNTFAIPEPFPNYSANGNDFFVTIGTTYIDPRRYTLRGNSIVFSDLTVHKGRTVSFNFIYSDSSVYSAIDIQKSIQSIIATEDNQTEFALNYPIEKYLEMGYKIYAKIKDKYISEYCYDIYRNTIRLREKSLNVGEELKLEFVHGPNASNISVLKDFRIVDTDSQTLFDIEYPTSDFLVKGNKVIIDMDGEYLEEGTGYNFSTDKSTIILSPNHYLPSTQLNYTFVYNTTSDYAIKFKQQVLIAEGDGQKEFYLDYPFYPYQQTTQGCIIIHRSLLVQLERITVNKFNCIIDIDNIKKGDEIVVLFIFNNKYLLDMQNVLIVEEKTVSTTLGIDDALVVDMPVPFKDYIENEWNYFVDSQRSRIDESTFEALGNGLSFINTNDILNYPTLTFTFVYKDSYLIKTIVEDYDTDADLKFIKIPLKAKTNTDYIKKLTNTKSYNSMTVSDQFWDGEDANDTIHNSIKSAIMTKEFNYARTKYMTVEYLLKLTDMSFEISYFYNMLYDDVFKEDLLTIGVSTISASKQFKLSHIFCYMTALAYLYSGMEDNIMDTPTKVLYVKGFNFTTDLESLRRYILNERRLPSDYDVFGFNSPSGQIPSLEEFVNIYKTNKNVYKTICYNMVHARNYDIYAIWKKLYDSLMIWKFNMNFFAMDDGTTASSFSSFLQEKDNVLYTSLNIIKNTLDQETRENAIVTMISDIVYILEEYISSKDFKFIYNQYPGVSKEYILQYLFMMINFFKSYKVVLKQMTVQFILDDENQNSIKIYDTQKMQVHLKKPDYITITDGKASIITLDKDDSIGVKEKLNRSYYWIP